MRFQHAKPNAWLWSFLTDISKSYWNLFDLHIVFDHIITTSPFCFLHKSGGLSVLYTLLCCKGFPSASSFFLFQLPEPLFSCHLVSFFIAVVLVFCESTLERETTKEKVSFASLSGWQQTISFSYSVLFCAFFSSFFWLFWSWAEELLIHCQMSDSKVALA